MIRRGLFDGGCGWVGHRVGWMLPGMGGGGGMVSGLITTSQRETMWQAAKPLPMEAKKGEAALRQAFLFASFSFRCVQNMKAR